MDGTIIGYVKISDNPLMLPKVPLANLGLKCLLLLNFTTIMWFFWDLGLRLFDIAKDIVFAAMLVLSSILGFPTVYWVPKWTKTVNFGCVPFDSKFELYKGFSKTVCLIGRLPLVKIS